MTFTSAVADELAESWARLHRKAARPHLELMIKLMQRMGDDEGAANYRRVLKALRAKETIKEFAD